MDPISIAMLAAKFAPSIIGFFTGKSSDKKKAEGVVNIIKQITGVADGENALKLMESNNELMLQFKTKVMDYQLAYAKEETKLLLAVNKTMRAESKSDHWMQWSWRPFNGYLFGTTLFLGYVVPALTNVVLAALNIEDGMVLRSVPYANIPEFALVAWGAVLGVTSWTRGAEKVAKVNDKESDYES